MLAHITLRMGPLFSRGDGEVQASKRNCPTGMESKARRRSTVRDQDEDLVSSCLRPCQRPIAYIGISPLIRLRLLTEGSWSSAGQELVLPPRLRPPHSPRLCRAKLAPGMISDRTGWVGEASRPALVTIQQPVTHSGILGTNGKGGLGMKQSPYFFHAAVLLASWNLFHSSHSLFLLGGIQICDLYTLGQAETTSQMDNQAQQQVETLPKGVVFIAGGGPVGLLVAKVLSHHGVRSVLFERNQTTTKWPKMDLTNSRSMEMFRRLGLSEGIRRLGVPSHIEQPVLISSGLSADAPIAKWDLPSVDRLRQQIQQNNDGTQPLEPWQRISQVLFEQYLKSLCDEDPLISVRFGYKVEDIEENDDNVCAEVVNLESGQTTTFVSEYVVGCDGASSKTRQSMRFALDGGPV